MHYHLDIPPGLRLQLDGLPAEVRRGFYGGLHLAAEALGDTGGRRAWGERVPDFLPPMYVLRSRGHRLLYEVDVATRRLVVRNLALPAPAPAEGAGGGGEGPPGLGSGELHVLLRERGGKR